jgi:hypothetical protein
MEVIMRRSLNISFLLFLYLFLSSPVFSGLVPARETSPSETSKIQETGEFRGDLEHTVYSNLCGDIHDRVICVDGFKVFQTVVYGFCNNGGGAAVSNIQLYIDKGGRVVPATCGDKKAEQK